MKVENYIAGVKKRTGKAYISAWVPKELKECLDRIARREGVKRAPVIRAALSFFIDAYNKTKTAEQAELTPPPRLGWRPMEVNR